MRLDERINGKTKLIGLLGNPVEHTVSPQLHNTLSRMLDINAVYIPIKVEKNGLESAVKGLKACNFTGFNVTIPFKEEIVTYVDECTPDVKLSGCANTVKNTDGRLYAYNTDADGFVRSFEEQTHTCFKGKSVVLFGAGGTARSLAIKIASEGAVKLYIANRTIQRAHDIADTVNSCIGKIAESMDTTSMERNGIIESCDIIVNTTSLGMHPNVDESPLCDSIRLDTRQIVYDVIYNPVKTKFLKQAESSGCKSLNGLGMLFYQGILAYEIWMQIDIANNIIKELSEEFLKYFGK